MASGWSNKGKQFVLGHSFRGVATPTNYYLRLITSATAPNADDDTVSGYTQVATGNGYTTGGYQLSLNATDWEPYSFDDTGDYGYIQLKDIVWTASGGNIPSDSVGARYAVLTDDNGTEASRVPYAWWDLTSDRTVSDTQTLTLIDCELRIT
jgi:hypothetical protein